MKKVSTLLSLAAGALLAALTACAGVEEERVAALETTLRKLDTRASTSLEDQAARLAALSDELTAMRAATPPAPAPAPEPTRTAPATPGAHPDGSAAASPSAPAAPTAAPNAGSASFDETTYGAVFARLAELERAYENMRALYLELQPPPPPMDMDAGAAAAPALSTTTLPLPSAPLPNSNATFSDYDLAALVGEGPSGVMQVSATSFTVSREWLAAQVRLLAANPKKPKFPTDKKSGGVKLAGINPQHLLGRLFFKNNDVVVTVAGRPVSTAAEIVPILRALDKPKVEVSVVRGKDELRLTYEFVK